MVANMKLGLLEEVLEAQSLDKFWQKHFIPTWLKQLPLALVGAAAKFSRGSSKAIILNLYLLSGLNVG